MYDINDIYLLIRSAKRGTIQIPEQVFIQRRVSSASLMALIILQIGNVYSTMIKSAP